MNEGGVCETHSFPRETIVIGKRKIDLVSFSSVVADELLLLCRITSPLTLGQVASYPEWTIHKGET